MARERLWTFPDDRNVNMLTKEACDAVGTLTATCGNGHLIWIPAVQVVSMLWLPAMGLAAWRVRRAHFCDMNSAGARLEAAKPPRTSKKYSSSTSRSPSP